MGNRWIEEAERTLDINSAELARRLQVKPSSISNYKHKRSHLDDDTAIKLGELIGIDPLKIIADQNAERAKTDRARTFWKRIGAAAAVILATAIGGLTPRHSAACGTSGDATGYTLCALDKRRRRDKRTTANSEAHHTRRRAIPRRQRKNRAPIPAH
jgi:plasmid maintenance system antidote protein VapI